MVKLNLIRSFANFKNQRNEHKKYGALFYPGKPIAGSNYQYTVSDDTDISFVVSDKKIQTMNKSDAFFIYEVTKDGGVLLQSDVDFYAAVR